MVGAGHRISSTRPRGEIAGDEVVLPQLDGAVTAIPGPAAPAVKSGVSARTSSSLPSSAGTWPRPPGFAAAGSQDRSPWRVQLKGPDTRGVNRIHSFPPGHQLAAAGREARWAEIPDTAPSATTHGPPPVPWPHRIHLHLRGEPAQPVMPLPSWVRKALSQRLNSAAMACSSASDRASPAPPRGCLRRGDG